MTIIGKSSSSSIVIRSRGIRARNGTELRELCERAFDHDFRRTADSRQTCCLAWRRAACLLDSLSREPANEASEDRASETKAQETRLHELGCSDLADRVTGVMPLSCYWHLRRSLLILICATGASAIVVSLTLFLTRRQRSLLDSIDP